MTQIKQQGIVDELNGLTIRKIEASKLLSDLKQELENTELYKRIQKGEEVLREINKEETELKEKGKNILLEAGMKKFESLDGTIIQLNKTPPKLVIKEKELIPAEYWKEKTTKVLDKKEIKENIKLGEVIDGVELVSDYKLIIKQG